MSPTSAEEKSMLVKPLEPATLVVVPSSTHVLPQSPFSSVQLAVTVVPAVGTVTSASWRRYLAVSSDAGVPSLVTSSAHGGRWSS
ncbi:hypothetical protein [Streptomyces paradoxus]|uniref:hypothetical protein n=1 Tax=Streptomyces paradoxus TaxID=66375 RepID=UPI0037CD710C